MKISEKQLCEHIAVYLQLQYPTVIYRFDLAADLKLTVGQAARHKKLHPKRGYPDLFIAKPMVVYSENSKFRTLNNEPVELCHGLFLELKKDGTRLKKKNGDWASEHIAEQAKTLEKLRKEGYKAEFACGFNEVVKLIDEYLKD